ncbi:MAG: hypothetical protein ABMB14_36845, partial [Myxococcota bacterium]
VVVPWLGLRGAIGVAAAVNALGAAVALRDRRWAAGLAAVAAVAALGIRAPWDPLWMSGGMYQYVSQFDDHTVAGMQKFATGSQAVKFYDEGRSSVVTVATNVNSGHLWLANNGKVDASTSGDLPTQVLVALAAAPYVDRPDPVLVIGLASGITAGAATRIPGIGGIEVVELEPAVVRAARLFDDYNHRVLDDPRVTVVVNDGRNHLLRAAPGTYPLVISEPSNPYLSGVANLFTREFWTLGHSRLAPGGVWAQWVQLYGMGPDELRGLIRTFADVYPYVEVIVAIGGADLVLLGSDRPLVPDLAKIRPLFDDPDVAAELRSVEIQFPMDLLAHHAMDRDQALAFAGDAPLVTDDNLRVEYAAPLWLHTDVSLRNWDELLAAAEVPWGSLPDDPLDWLDLAATYDRLEDPRRARQVRERLLSTLPEGDALRAELIEALYGDPKGG